MQLVAGTVVADITTWGSAELAVVIDTIIIRVKENTFKFTATGVMAVGTVTGIACGETEVIPVFAVVVETA